MGILSRIIGFFYKIFLSRAIGAESLGLYQLIGPVLGLCFSLCSSGIQTALSRFVAQEKGSRRRAMRYFYMALLLSCSIAVLMGTIIWKNADWIAIKFLGDERCAPLLSIMVYSLIPACVHSCINGYYYGLKKAAVPSISQMAEQIVRVGAVYLIWQILMEQGIAITAVHAIWGTIIGELAGMLYSVTAMSFHCLKKGPVSTAAAPVLTHRRALSLLLSMAIPLTLNRVLVNFCTSVEHMLIPQKLRLYGLSQSEALSVYGVLSGMAMAILMFPNVLTGSLSVLLLPAVSEAKSHNHERSIALAAQRAVKYGLLLGFGFAFVFFIGGNYLGVRIFHSSLAGVFIRRLSWICPFMYISGMMNSILHGLGKAKTVLFISLLSCLIRIFFILVLVPEYGIHAYLWSILLSHIFSALAAMVPMRKYLYT